MKTLLCCSASKSFFGWAIRKITKAHVNHAFILYESDYWGRWMAVEIAEDGPIPCRPEKVLKGCSFLEVFEPDYNIQYGVQVNMSRLNRGYDWLGILGFLWGYVKSWVTKKPVKNSFHSSGRDFCSEYVAHVIKDSPGSGGEQIDPDSTSPKSLRIMWHLDALRYRQMTVEELLATGLPIPLKLQKKMLRG